jgi:hypothetical protein
MRLNSCLFIIKHHFMPPCPSTAASIVPCQTGNDRVSRFISTKINVFNNYHRGRPENRAFTLTFDQFKVFLDIFQNANPPSSGNFSGIRVYFANYIQTPHDMGNAYFGAQDVDKLVLIFVPTTANASGAQDDVQSMYYALINGVGQLLNNPTTVSDKRMDTASNWVRHYQRDLMPRLIADGQPGNAHFVETKSMWYPWWVFFGNPTIPDPGLYGYMQCMHDNPPDVPHMVDGVNIRFACYLVSDTNLSYQLTLVFDLHQVEDGNLTGSDAGPAPCDQQELVTGGVPAQGVPGVTRQMIGVPTDTGFPCPPDTGCLNGITLPAS